MEAILRTYGVWILLVGVFVAMHWFGMGCGGGHDRAGPRQDEPRKPGDKKPAAEASHPRGCH